VAYGPGQAFPPQPPVPEGAGVNPAWLASSADRERAVGVLRAGFTEGRLSQDELDDRVAGGGAGGPAPPRAGGSPTYGQLWELTADLPAGALPYPQFPQGQGLMVAPEAVPPSHWKPAAALIITALVIFTLAALITAVITAHTQSVVYPPGFQPANLTPFIQPVVLPPHVIHVAPVVGAGG
jgi:hypothetical protein